MIDEVPERMCQFNDQEIRRKGKLLMAKVVATARACERAGETLSITKREREATARRRRVTNCARKLPATPSRAGGIMDSRINETAGAII